MESRGVEGVTYTFLAQGYITARLNQIKVGAWKDNIHDMLQRIPHPDDVDSDDEREEVNVFPGDDDFNF